jgi:hypothetical protein
MPVWPKFVYTFGVNMKTAATEWRLRQKTNAPARQDAAFRHLTDQLAGTSFWKKAGIERGMPYAQFQSRVPLHRYDMLADAIGETARGAENVLWPGPCSVFAGTAGTTGEPKLLPVTEEILAHFRQAGMASLLYYTVRVKNAGAFRGRHLLLGSSTELSPLTDAKPHEAFAGEMSGIAAVDLPAWADKHLYEPGARVARTDDWDAKVTAIIERTRQRDITLVAGLPTWTTSFIDELHRAAGNQGQGLGPLDQYWPNLECFVHTGVPVRPFSKRLHALLGPGVKFHEIYAASEGFIAAQDTEAGDALRLMADQGLFFEFLPMSEFSPARVEQLGPKAVPLAQVKIGVDYALILTTPGGLARYVLEDVVRFSSTTPPRLVYVGRTELMLNAFGERVMEKDVTDALVSLCNAQSWDIVNFHVAPLFGSAALTGQKRGAHEWWVELRPGTVSTPTGPQMALALDAELQRAHVDYAARRKTGILESPTVRLVMPGVFEHWLRHQGKWGGQQKLARCRSDRLIADPLAKLTHFAQD